ncbi:MAG: hypothetical protein WAW81_02245 [Minisyncoccia bacterium]
MFGLIFATIVFGVFLLIVLGLARLKILWVIVPSNCYSLVTTLGNKSGDMTQGGGGVTNIIHNVPGMRLVKESYNLMEWHFRPGRERRGLLFFILGVTWIGFFRTLRTNKIRRFRYSKNKDEKKDGAEKTPIVKKDGVVGDYFIEGDDLTTEFVPFSGEMAILVTKAETRDIFELDFLFNAIEEAVRPLMAIRVADANAILAGMIKEKVNAVTGPEAPEFFIKASPASTKKIVQAAKKATKGSEAEIGKKIVRINLISTDMDEKDRTLFELPAKTERENAAAVAIAEKDKEVKLRANTADADRVTRVIIPASETPERAANYRADRFAAAHEVNKTLTTLVTGQGAVPVVPLSKIA